MAVAKRRHSPMSTVVRSMRDEKKFTRRTTSIGRWLAIFAVALSAVQIVVQALIR